MSSIYVKDAEGRPNFQCIPQFTKESTYEVDVSWTYFRQHVQQHVEDYGLDVDPDFQRGHVWTREQQIAYIEFCLRGGRSASRIQLNCPGWKHGHFGDYVLVDGKQRLTAILAFLNDEIEAFGHKYSQYAGILRLHGPRVKWCVNDLETKAQVLTWYLEMNTGGVVHTKEEIDRVRQMLVEEEKKENPEVCIVPPYDQGFPWTLEKAGEKAVINAVTAETLRHHGAVPLQGVSGAFDRHALIRALARAPEGFKLSKKAKKMLEMKA